MKSFMRNERELFNVCFMDPWGSGCYSGNSSLKEGKSGLQLPAIVLIQKAHGRCYTSRNGS